MISDTELLNWTKAEPEDVPVLRALERAAIATIEHRTGRYWGVETEIVETRFWRGSSIELRATPVDGVVTVEYWDGSAWTAADSSTFYPSERFLRLAGSPPTRWSQDTETRLTYTAGFTVDEGDEDVWDAPEDIQLAVKLLVGHFYLNRETVVIGVSANEVPFGVDALIRDHRRMTA